MRAVTIDELAARSPRPAQLEKVFRDEVERGRVIRNQGGYRIYPPAFPAEVLFALARIRPVRWGHVPDGSARTN